MGALCSNKINTILLPRWRQRQVRIEDTETDDIVIDFN